jgi:MFS family permease
MQDFVEIAATFMDARWRAGDGVIPFPPRTNGSPGLPRGSGWILDAFDFTIFLFLMAPIAKEFGVSVTAVAAVLALTIWMRLVGAVTSGWLADRIGRKTPLMLSILWYSICNFIAGFSPNLTFLLVVRAALD